MPMHNGKRITLAEWRVLHPIRTWPPTEPAPEPVAEVAAPKQRSKRKKVATESAILAATGVTVTLPEADDEPA